MSAMSDSARIEADVLAELNGDPRLPSPSEIAVKAYDGAIALRGTVGSFAQRRAAGDDAAKIQGVYDVENELQVRLMDSYAREDAEIRGAALQSLMLDSAIPSGALDVHDQGHPQPLTSSGASYAIGTTRRQRRYGPPSRRPDTGH